MTSERAYMWLELHIECVWIVARAMAVAIVNKNFIRTTAHVLEYPSVTRDFECVADVRKSQPTQHYIEFRLGMQ